MDRTERFYRIELAIRGRQGVSFGDLLKELEVSPATLKRDWTQARAFLKGRLAASRD